MTLRIIRHTLMAVVVLAVSWPVRAAGPAGHYIIGKTIVEGAQSGQTEVPPELKAALATPEGRRSFYGGAVGPDICEGQSHYGNTADLARKLLDAARADIESARYRHDAEQTGRAQRELAFAYGWLAHCGTDLNVHPKINALVGDTYRYNTSAQQKQHAAWEAQLTAYLKRSFMRPGDQFDVSVPYEFLSRVSGVDESKLRQGMTIVKGKTIAEFAFAGNVTLSDAELARMWREVVRASRADSIEYIRDVGRMGNWDLDCGKLSTQEFDQFRDLVKEANGGKLPSDWGRKYLQWWAAVKGLSRADRLARLRELLGGKPVKPSASSGDGGVFLGPMAALDVPSMLRKTKMFRLDIPCQTEMVRSSGLQTYWLAVLIPGDPTFPWPGLAGMVWTYPHGTWRVSGDDSMIQTTIEADVDMAPDGSMIRRLVARQRRTMGSLRLEVDLDLRDIPLNRRIVGTLYEGDVQYAIWDPAKARQSVASSAMREIDTRDGSLFSSGKGFRWPTGEQRKPVILVRFKR
jgi:hypothetical protein